jgi:stage III sporulation protein AE
LICLLTLNVRCSAEAPGDELYGALPPKARETLDSSGVTPSGGAESVGLKEILASLTELVAEHSGKPMRMFAALTALILLTSLTSAVGEAAGGSGAGVCRLVSAVSAAVIVSGYMADIIDAARSAAGAAADFTLAYIPVIAGVTAAGGHTGSAALFSSVTLTAIQLLSRLTAAVIIPLTGCMLGITAAGSADPDLKLDRLGEGLKKLIVWGLGLTMTLFLGILSVQSIITASADSAALKTLKFAVSSTVPIVGGAVSEALATVSGSISLMKSGIGGFGIAAGACVLAPSAAAAVCGKFFLFAAGVISDLFGCPETGRMIKAGENVMSVILAVLSCFFVFMTVSTGVLLAFCRS